MGVPKVDKLNQVHEACDADADVGKPGREQMEFHPYQYNVFIGAGMETRRPEKRGA